MTTAQQILEAAYSRSTGNDPGKLATDDELLARLRRIYSGLFALAARQRPDDYATKTAQTLIGGDAHFALAPDTIDVRRMQTATGAKVHLIPATELERTWHVPPSMYRTGNTVTSRGAAGDPIRGDVLTVWLLGPAAALAALTDALDAVFPIRHVDILINDIALYLDAKDEDRDPMQFQKLAADMNGKLGAFALEFGLEADALEFVHAPATRQPAGGKSE